MPDRPVPERRDDPHQDQDREHKLKDGAAGTESDEESDSQHDDNREQVAYQIGHGTARNHRRRRHRKRAEPVDQPTLHILGQPDGCDDAAEGDGLHEDPRHEVVHVLSARHLDGAAEDIAEQHHEHHRLDRDKDNQLRLPPGSQHASPSQ